MDDAGATLDAETAFRGASSAMLDPCATTLYPDAVLSLDRTMQLIRLTEEEGLQPHDPFRI